MNYIIKQLFYDKNIIKLFEIFYLSYYFIFGIPEKWDRGPICGTQDPSPGTLHLGPFTWDPSPRTQEPEPVGGTWDLYMGSRTWDPSLVTRDLEPGTLYVGNGTQYLYVERGTHT